MKVFKWFKRIFWKKSVKDSLRLHVAGATIKHSSKFDHLDSYINNYSLSKEFADKWVVPFYFNINKTDSQWFNYLAEVKSEITDDIVLNNLGDFNWRTRQTGAFFASILGMEKLTDIIGIHLLKSEVCYAGKVYAKTLASFNTELSISYLERYLEFYLLKKDLEFDQKSVLIAIKYLDEVNGTNKLNNHFSNWNYYISDRKKEILFRINDKSCDKPNYLEDGYWEEYLKQLENLDISNFKNEMEFIKKVRAI